MNIVVDIGDMQVSADPRVDLITYSLGSCIGLSIWDPEIHVGGLLHYMLPESSISPQKAKLNPAMFGDTGIPALFRAAYELGAVKNRLIVKVAGGSSLLDDNGRFNIGKRNYTILRKLFWKNGVLIDSENAGGSLSRTMRLRIADGQVVIRNQGREMAI
jgi:chemotaxis protein CheD